MASGNGSSSVQTEFYCCCSITHEHFIVTVPTGVYVFNATILVLTSIFATIGNLLVLVSMWRTPALHSPSNVLLFGLALSDLGVGLSVGPLTLVSITTAQFNGLWLVHCVSLVTCSLAAPMLIFASLATVTSISLDMYFALYLHLRYREIVTTKKTIAVLVGIWVYAVVVSLLNTWYKKYLSLVWPPLMVLFLMVTTITYFRVFKIVRHHQSQIHAQATIQQQSYQENVENQVSIAQQKKSLVTKFLVYCLLVACFLPLSVLKAARRITGYSVTIESMFRMSYVMVCFNSAMNPFIYCLRFEKIRKAVIETTRIVFRRQTSVQQ